MGCMALQKPGFFDKILGFEALVYQMPGFWLGNADSDAPIDRQRVKVRAHST
jgi:hypothetical protein